MFKIGDRVRVIRDFCYAKSGMEGVIKVKKPRLDRWGVEFDKEFSGGHTCGGTVSSKRGQWVDPGYLELIKPTEKIVITHDGKTTLARLYEGKTVVKSAEAKCDPRDEFSFAVGAEIALERLTEEEEEDPPFKVGDVVRIKAAGYHTFSDGLVGRVWDLYGKKRCKVKAYNPKLDATYIQTVYFEDLEKVTNNA